MCHTHHLFIYPHTMQARIIHISETAQTERSEREGNTQMPRQQKIRNPLMYRILMSAIPTYQLALNNLRLLSSNQRPSTPISKRGPTNLDQNPVQLHPSLLIHRVRLLRRQIGKTELGRGGQECGPVYPWEDVGDEGGVERQGVLLQLRVAEVKGEGIRMGFAGAKGAGEVVCC